MTNLPIMMLKMRRDSLGESAFIRNVNDGLHGQPAMSLLLQRSPLGASAVYIIVRPVLHVENNLLIIFNFVPEESAQARSPRDARRQQTSCAAAVLLAE